MKTVTANFTDERDRSVIGGTKTQISLTTYESDWTLVGTEDITDRLIGKLPSISMDIERGSCQFTKDSVVLDLLDDDRYLHDKFDSEEYWYLLKIEKGFSDVADWVVVFDGIIDVYETEHKHRNITSVTAYSMEGELDLVQAWQVYDNTAAPFPNINSAGAAFTINAIAIGDGQPGVKKMEYEYHSGLGSPYKLIYDGGAPVYWGLNVLQWIYDATGTHGLQIQSSNNAGNFSQEDQTDIFVIGDLSNLASIGNWWNNRTLNNLVNDLWDLSNINIPGGNRTVSIPNQSVPYADFSQLTAREALDKLAEAYSCVHKRTIRDTAMFVTRHYIGGTRDLDSDLYKPNIITTWKRGIDGAHVKNTKHKPGTQYVIVDEHNLRASIVRAARSGGALSMTEREAFKTYVDYEWEAYSAGYTMGDNITINNRFIRDQACWAAEELWSWNRYNRRLFAVPAFFMIELEPYDRVNLTVRDKDGAIIETVLAIVKGWTYNDDIKMTDLVLEELKPVIYERNTCEESGDQIIAGLTQWAQTYTIGNIGYGANHDLESYRLKMYRVGNPGNLTVAVHNTAAGVPVGAALDSITVNANLFTATSPGIWYDFDLTGGVNQVNGTMYAIVCSAPGAIAGNSVRWRQSPNIYGGGGNCNSLDGGTSWNIVGAADFMFEQWGLVV